jgi:phage baseplate assembly protein W
MTFRVANKFPIDTKPRVAVGVSLPFSSPSVFTSTYTTKDQLKSNLLNYFMTSPGERYMKPLFGGGLRDIVFENLEDRTFDIVKQRVQADLNTYFPNVQIDALDVFGTPDENILMVNLKYSVSSFGITDNIEIIIS